MSKKKLDYPYKLVVVMWTDAVYDNSDAKKEDELTPDIVVTTGWLLKDAENYVVVAHEYGDDDWVRHRTTIPRKMIESMRVIKTSRKR